MVELLFWHLLNTRVVCVLCWQAQLVSPDIRTLCQHQTSRLRFINPMDYCKSLYCCWKLFGLSFHVRCWSSPWWLLRGYWGAVFGRRLSSKLPWFPVLLDLLGECTNSCVGMDSFVLGEVVGLGEEWWLTCVFVSSLTKDVFKGMWLVTAAECSRLPYSLAHPSLIPGVPVVYKGHCLVHWSLQPFCRNRLLYTECELGLTTSFWREFNASQNL